MLPSTCVVSCHAYIARLATVAVPVSGDSKADRNALRGASLLSYIMAQGRALMSVQLTSALLWAQ